MRLPLSDRHKSAHARAMETSFSVGVLPLKLMMSLLRRPGRSLTVVLASVAGLSIIGNALSDGQGPHPAPLFETRAGEAGASQAVKSVERVSTAPAKGRETNAVSPSQAVQSASGERAPHGIGYDDAVAITTVQSLLLALGYYQGDVDGLMGPKTEAAIRDFESREALPLTGRPSEALLVALRDVVASKAQVVPDAQQQASNVTTPTASQDPQKLAAVPLRKPQVDSNVRRLQQALVDTGYGPIDVDGLLGQQTSNAIRKFQKANGLEVTGEVSDRLWAQLILSGGQ